jgi:hypothetical protein
MFICIHIEERHFLFLAVNCCVRLSTIIAYRIYAIGRLAREQHTTCAAKNEKGERSSGFFSSSS